MAEDWRARKRERTRTAIQEAALRLFLDKGFEETTVAQIAEAAGVSHMTVFRYFPAKEDLVLFDTFDPLIEEWVRSRPAEEPAVLRVQRTIVQGLEQVYEDYREILLTRVRLALSTPALRGRLWENQFADQHVLERALTGPGADAVPLRVRVAAAACIATLTTAIITWAESEQPGYLPALIDEAFEALRSEMG